MPCPLRVVDLRKFNSRMPTGVRLQSKCPGSISVDRKHCILMKLYFLTHQYQVPYPCIAQLALECRHPQRGRGVKDSHILYIGSKGLKLVKDVLHGWPLKYKLSTALSQMNNAIIFIKLFFQILQITWTQPTKQFQVLNTDSHEILYRHKIHINSPIFMYYIGETPKIILLKSLRNTEIYKSTQQVALTDQIGH